MTDERYNARKAELIGFAKEAHTDLPEWFIELAVSSYIAEHEPELIPPPAEQADESPVSISIEAK